MSSVDTESFIDALKEFYSEEQVKMQAYTDNPTLAMLEKKFNCGGSEVVQPVQYGIHNGRSRQFAKSQTNKRGNKYIAFHVTYSDDFATMSITRKVMLQSAGAGKKAFFEARQREVDGMLEKLTQSTARSIFRGSGGMIGQISSTYASGTTITLSDPDDIVNFEEGDVLNLSANDGEDPTDVLITSGGDPVTTVVVSVNRDAGSMVVSDDTNLAASRYLFIDGDFQAATHGFAAWIPLTAPTSGDDFMSVDRSVDTRLSGTRVTATNVSISEAIQTGISRLGREGCTPNLAVMNHARYKDLILEQGNKVVYDTVKAADLDIGFNSIQFTTGKKPVNCIADHNCQSDTIWLLTKDTWAIYCLNKTLPELVTDGGSAEQREVAAAGVELRADAYYELICTDPRANARITVE